MHAPTTVPGSSGGVADGTRSPCVLHTFCDRSAQAEVTLCRKAHDRAGAGCGWRDPGAGGAGDQLEVRGICLAWWSTGRRCGTTDDSSVPCWSVYAEDRLTGRLTPCGN